MEYAFYRDTYRSPEREEMLKTLEEYVFNHPCDIDADVIHEVLKKTGHMPIIEAILDYFMLRVNKKKNCIWVSGDSNNGKSELVEFLNDIFHCYKF